MTAPDASPLPAALRLAWWGTAWLRGYVVTDLLIDALIDTDATHLVAGFQDGPGLEPVEGLAAGLGRLRAWGATGIGAAFPAEGDPVGLGGPAEFNAEAIEAGEAVVVLGTGLGLVPERVGAAVTWQAHPAHARQVPDVGEADRALRQAIPEAADELARLDVARWRPELADRLHGLRLRPRLTAPDGVPARCVELAARGLQAGEIVELGLDTEADALTAHDAAARRAVLAPLGRAARRALVAAGSPEGWPP